MEEPKYRIKRDICIPIFKGQSLTQYCEEKMFLLRKIIFAKIYFLNSNSLLNKEITTTYNGERMQLMPYVIEANCKKMVK